jgi:hypothetical protein
VITASIIRAEDKQGAKGLVVISDIRRTKWNLGRTNEERATIRTANIPPCLINFDISARFFARELFIALMMELVFTPETFYFNETTQCNIPEGYYLHTHRCENMKSDVAL